MRLHRLVMQAFGPFKGREEIDFDALSAGGLFLLNGDTGAGKTTVLDAICFALYGSLPGVREGSTTLRSAYAEENVAPEVVCEFSVGGRRFEAHRSPAWERPKKRGSGTTLQQATCSLREDVGGQWVVLSTRNDEVGQAIKGLLSMGKEEFTRVAMLPQGEFAAFLRAGDSERAELLRKLFDVSTYQQVEAILAERRRELARRAEAADREHSELVSRILRDAAAHLQEEESDAKPWALETDESVLPESGELRRSVETRRAKALERVEAETIRADECVSAARTALEELRRSGDDHRLLTSLEAQRAEHQARRSGVDASRERLAAHSRAERVSPAERRLSTATRTAEQAEAALEAARERALSAAGFDEFISAEATEQEPGALDVAVEAAGAALARAEAFAERERDLEQGRKDADAAKQRQADIAGDLDRLSAHVATSAEERERLAGEQAALSGAAADLATLTRSAEDAARIRDAAQARDDYAPHVDAAHRAWVTAEEGAVRARQHRLDLEKARLDAAAFRLAEKLVDGEPCEVCGSTEHPQPARQPDGDSVTDADIERAEQAFNAADQAARLASDAKAKAIAELARLTGIAGELSLAEAEEALRTAENSRDQAQAAAQRAAETAQRLATIQEQAEASQRRQRELEQEHAVLGDRIAQLGVANAALERELAAAAAPAATVSERIDGLRSCREALGAWRDHAAEHARAVTARFEAATELEAALASEEFADLEAARAALLGSREASELSASVRSFEDQEIRLAQLGEEPAIARALAARNAGEEPPTQEQLAAAGTKLEEAEASLRVHTEQRGALRSYTTRSNEDLDALDVLIARQGALLNEFDVVKGLADTVAGSGENSLKMALSTYVLAARLEAVAAAASERLSVMTGGRFELRHNDATGGRGRGGLGLSVIDEWNGQTRDPSSLSGGESFMASLALALGLADVVQAESGGVDMETLFVDEGFGTLDAATLELVMRSLDDLRTSGRVVGVISHVAELKNQIATQLVVHKGREGSTTSLQADLYNEVVKQGFA